MNTIVRKRVLAARLPEEFRPGIGADQQVTVTVELESSSEAEKPPTRDELLALVRAVRKQPQLDDDPVARIRALRDEWDN